MTHWTGPIPETRTSANTLTEAEQRAHAGKRVAKNTHANHG